MKAVRFLFLLLLTIHTGLSAESILSSKGLGIPSVICNASSLGMGGLSIAKADAISLNLGNPAALYKLKQTTFTIQEIYESTTAQDHSYKEKSISSNFHGFSFYVPLGTKTGIQLGLRPETRVDYDMTYKGTISGEDFLKTVTGSGGLNSVSMGTFYSFSPKFTLGVTGQLLFGKIRDLWLVDYSNSSFVKSRDEISTHLYGENITVGVMSELTPHLSLGMVYSPEITLDSETDMTSANRNETETHSGKVTYPGMFGIGISYLLRSNMSAGFEFSQTEWDQYAVNGVNTESLVNSSQIRTGIEWIPSLDSFSPYHKRIVYRAGAAYNSLPVKDIKGETIREIWGTMGFSLPLFQNQAYLDMAINYGIRGDLTDNGIQENIWRFSISLTGSEKWFVRKY